MSQYDNLLSIIHYLYTNSEGQPLLGFSDVSRHYSPRNTKVPRRSFKNHLFEKYSAYSKSYTKPTLFKQIILFKVKTYGPPQTVYFKLLSEEATDSRTRGEKRRCIRRRHFPE